MAADAHVDEFLRNSKFGSFRRGESSIGEAALRVDRTLSVSGLTIGEEQAAESQQHQSTRLRHLSETAAARGLE
jgi:hypothetical protein